MNLSIALIYGGMLLGVANMLTIFTNLHMSFALIVSLQICTLFAIFWEAAAWHIKRAFKDGAFRVAVNIKKEDLK